MFDNDFLFQNTALMAAFTGFPNLKRSPEMMLDEILKGYDNISKEQILKHVSEFSSREEMERYVHRLAVHSHTIEKWQ